MAEKQSPSTTGSGDIPSMKIPHVTSHPSRRVDLDPDLMAGAAALSQAGNPRAAAELSRRSGGASLREAKATEFYEIEETITKVCESILNNVVRKRLSELKVKENHQQNVLARLLPDIQKIIRADLESLEMDSFDNRQIDMILQAINNYGNRDLSELDGVSDGRRVVSLRMDRFWDYFEKQMRLGMGDFIAFGKDFGDDHIYAGKTLRETIKDRDNVTRRYDYQKETYEENNE